MCSRLKKERFKRSRVIDADNEVDWAFRSRSRALVDANPNSRENVMRHTLETLLGRPCPKARPAFLRNPDTKRRLELDAWCETLKLGCEFQGIQHSQYPNPVHLTRAEFDNQVKRDALKQHLCSEHGVSLVLVPHTVTVQTMNAYLETQLRELGMLPVTSLSTIDAPSSPGKSDDATGIEASLALESKEVCESIVSLSLNKNTELTMHRA